MTNNLSHLPLLLTHKQAAENIGLDVATFRAWVECGRLPKPLPDVGLFYLKALDAEGLKTK